MNSNIYLGGGPVEGRREDNVVGGPVEMRKVGGTPIGEKITSMRSLAPCQRRRLKRLRDILRKEGILSMGISVWEKRYLLKRERERQRRRRRQEEGMARVRWEQARQARTLTQPSLEELLKMLAQGEPEKTS